MRIVLAPMEGLADVHLRRLLAAQGGFDWVVSEFVRVGARGYPDRVFITFAQSCEITGKLIAGRPFAFNYWVTI
jgi:tRNA-dihydrouridine synthase C